MDNHKLIELANKKHDINRQINKLISIRHEITRSIIEECIKSSLIDSFIINWDRLDRNFDV